MGFNIVPGWLHYSPLHVCSPLSLQEERLLRERALADALEVADSSRAWRVGGWGTGQGSCVEQASGLRCTSRLRVG
jgi:hypothetical protein